MTFEQIDVQDYFGYAPVFEEVVRHVQSMFQSSPGLMEVKVNEFIDYHFDQACMVTFSFTRVESNSFHCFSERHIPYDDEAVLDGNDWCYGVNAIYDSYEDIYHINRPLSNFDDVQYRCYGGFEQ